MPEDVKAGIVDSNQPPRTESTIELLTRAREGDRTAIERLFARHLRPLQRFARGRMPAWARGLTDTDDVVQDALLQTFKRIDRFESRHPGALQADLAAGGHESRAGRDSSTGTIAEPRRCRRCRARMAGIAARTDRKFETMAAYEQGLSRLRPEEREAIIGRLEMGFSYEELALALEKPTADAARKAAQRALVRLAHEMNRE